MRVSYVFVVALLLLVCYSNAVNNGLALTPQLGWNSWNHYHCSVNETLIRATAAAMVHSGLAGAGYKYVNIDDCWAKGRYSNGSIYADPVAFPSGMPALAAYVHSLGLKFGLYTDLGNYTCAGRPGSLGYEHIDAQTYASWNVDYIKVDNCFSGNIPPTVRYPVMRDALNSTGRPIFFSLCEWGVDNPATWAPQVGNSWRTTNDIQDNWASMTSNLDENNIWNKYAAPGGWNDPDMLEVGNGGMTYTEYQSHFSLWSLSKSPLLIGCDVTNLSPQTLAILTAPEVIAVNQDPLGVQGHNVNSTGPLGVYQVWAGPLSGGSTAAVLFNRGLVNTTITALFTDLGFNANTQATVRDLWARKNLGTFQGSFSAAVPSHGVVMVKLTPTS